MPELYRWWVTWPLQIVELIMVLAVSAMILAHAGTKTAPSGFRFLEKWLGQLARRKGLSVLAVGLAAFAIRGALVPVLGVPEPQSHDEFSYLLAADTFAHGRLTNSPHPMWMHFETFHVIQQPTYMSVYPPAQGLVLAAGQLLGHAWLAQWVITAVMCSALCWMLQGWLPPRWALFGGMLAVLRLGIVSYWVNGYWSASVVALGGALVLGALPRLKRRPHPRDAIWMAVGLAILANSRPYEGLVLSLTVAAAMLVWLVGPRRPQASIALRGVVLPVVLLLAITAAATGYYYHRVTGNALRMTYDVERESYGSMPFLLWQRPRPEPAYHHAVVREFYEWDLRNYQESRTLEGFLRKSNEKVLGLWRFYLGPLLTLPLVAFSRILRDRRMRFPLIAGGVFLLGLVGQTWTLPHYLAPATGLVYLVLVQGLRHLRLWRWQQQLGVSGVRAIPVIACAMILLRVVAVTAHAQIEPQWPHGNLNRAKVVRELEHTPGRHLVIVRYGPHHNVHWEWVYNAADIDNAKIVWARDMGEPDNQELIRYFADRKLWLLNADESPPQLQAYERTGFRVPSY